MTAMESSTPETGARSWLRCYRCWSQDLEVQVHYEGIHKINPDTGERAEVIDELQEAFTTLTSTRRRKLDSVLDKIEALRGPELESAVLARAPVEEAPMR